MINLIMDRQEVNLINLILHLLLLKINQAQVVVMIHHRNQTHNHLLHLRYHNHLCLIHNHHPANQHHLAHH